MVSPVRLLGLVAYLQPHHGFDRRSPCRRLRGSATDARDAGTGKLDFPNGYFRVYPGPE